MIKNLYTENNIVDRISIKDYKNSENILDRILIEEEINNFKKSLIYIVKKSFEANFDSITPRTARRETEHIQIKGNNYNKDIELICITDEGKDTREEIKILYSVII